LRKKKGGDQAAFELDEGPSCCWRRKKTRKGQAAAKRLAGAVEVVV
jgi:hypothetical protein